MSATPQTGPARHRPDLHLACVLAILFTGIISAGNSFSALWFFLYYPFQLVIGRYGYRLAAVRFFTALVPVSIASGSVYMFASAGLQRGPETIFLAGAIGSASAGYISAGFTHAELNTALDRLGLPRVLLLAAGFMARYAEILKTETGRLIRARDSRGYPGSLGYISRAAVAGRIAGAVYVRGLDRAERVTAAMTARGYGFAPTRTATLPVSGFSQTDIIRISVTAGWLIIGAVIFFSGREL